ncbi:MAG TPA: CRTAC1 family protein [Candidatus Limnocylindrales bacterium]|nr:CRTAC1 family protein [Candidatus Limnocylindrales bacterium]
MTRRRNVAIVAALAVVGAVGVAASIRVLRPGATSAALGAPHFVDERATAGLVATYDGDSDFATGGGVAAFDCDDDGRSDLLVAGGAGPSTIDRNESPVGGPLRFAPAASGTAGSQDAVLGPGVLGAYPLDVDGDGHVDLAILRTDGLRLLRGIGDCRFADGNPAWSLDGGSGWTSGFSASWEGTATLPTLAIGHYLKVVAGTPTFDCDDDALVRPLVEGSAYGAPLTLAPGYCTLSMLFSDWDRSGRRDLRVTNDRQYYRDGEEQLWRVEPGATPRLYTDADGWRRVEIWGMGIASQDVTGDGYPDVYLTSQGDNKLQTLAAGAAQPGYRDIALKRGVTVTQPFTGGDALPSTAWHPEFEDVNNDGFIDLFVSKGNVNVMPDYAAKDPSNLLLGQPDGTFVEGAGAAGIVTFDRGRGAAIADFNLDGLLDLVQVNYGQPLRVWRNVGGGDATTPTGLGSWLALRLSQPGPNRDAIGAWVEVRVGDTTTTRELTVGGGHLGGKLGWVHFGIGTADGADVRVRWPDGETGPWLHAAADGFFDIERGATAIQPWTPAHP